LRAIAALNELIEASRNFKLLPIRFFRDVSHTGTCGATENYAFDFRAVGAEAKNADWLRPVSAICVAVDGKAAVPPSRSRTRIADLVR